MWSFEHWLIGTLWPLSKAYLHEALSLTVPIIRITTFPLHLLSLSSSLALSLNTLQLSKGPMSSMGTWLPESQLRFKPWSNVACWQWYYIGHRKEEAAFSQTTYSQLNMIKPKIFIWCRVLELKDMGRDPLVGKKTTDLLACKIKFPFREKLQHSLLLNFFRYFIINHLLYFSAWKIVQYQQREKLRN